MLHRGTIIRWNDEKGYGFIRPEDGGDHVFLHLHAVTDRTRRPARGDQVSFELQHVAGKGPRAHRATLQPADPSGPARAIRGAPRRRASGPPHAARGSSLGPAELIFALLIPIIFLSGAWLAAERRFIPLWVAVLYLGASVFTAGAYAVDKYRARRDHWRISEGTLHLFELAGGWPGALTAQRFLRHKTRKLGFQVTFWIIVLAHLAFWSWFTANQCGWLPR